MAPRQCCVAFGERQFALLPASLAKKALEALEDEEDIAAAKAARAEPSVAYAQVRAELHVRAGARRETSSRSVVSEDLDFLNS